MTLKRLRDLGNTVIVVEHDEDAIMQADYVFDIGPGAGIHGGQVVAEGTPDELLANKASLTGKYLTGEMSVKVPAKRRKPDRQRMIRLVGARGNNLKDVSADIPLGTFTCITGVSGGGKSTLVVDTLYKAVARKLNGSLEHPAPFDRVEGLEHLDKVIDIDQSPIGRTPLDPATYIGAFTPIASGSPTCRGQGPRLPGRTLSFNVKGGRCEACSGDGVIKIEMHFLPDVYVTCDVCKGKRYDRETLEVKYRDRSISDVLDMTVEEARDLFKAVPSIREKMQTLAPDRSRLRACRPAGHDLVRRRGAAREVVERALASSDGPHALHPRRPTTGLHFHDVAKLLEVLHEFVDQGNSVVVIEHNLEVIKTADWVIDMGPEGGDGGGRIVAQETCRGYREVTGQPYRTVPQGRAGAASIEARKEDARGGRSSGGPTQAPTLNLPWGLPS